MDGEQEFTHDRADSLELLEAVGVDKMAVEGPDIGVITRGAESGHIESDPQGTLPGLGQGGFFAHAGAGRVLAWIEVGHGAPLLGAHVVRQDQPLAEKLDGTGGGDTGGADEQLEGLLERFIRRNEVRGPGGPGTRSERRSGRCSGAG